MWSWLIIVLISITCFFCFITVVKFELGKSSARIWLIITCCSVAGVIGALVSAPSPNMKEFSYEMKPPRIEIKELKTPDEEADKVDEGDEQKETEPGDKDTMENQASTKGRAMVTVSKLNIRAEPDINAQVTGAVQNGDVLTILDAPGDLDWVKIKTSGGFTGWVAKRYLRLLPEGSE